MDADTLMLTVICGDAVSELRKLPDKSVQCCVTSPPFWGLRDYGSCSCGSGRFDLGQGEGTGGNLNYRAAQQFKFDCVHCNGTGRIIGTENQLGLEKTPEEYVAKMVKVFQEVRRVLRKDGTLWLNLGDSYAGSGKGLYSDGNCYLSDLSSKQRTNVGANGVKIGSVEGDAGHTHGVKPPAGLKAKDLIGIPWRVAFALQADGWWLRSDIIWAKPNPMPESVTDRPTKSHEYLFLLTKSANYFYDYQAILEPAAYDGRIDTVMKGSPKYADGFVPNQSAQTVQARGHERWPNKLAYRQKNDHYGPNGQAFNQVHAVNGVQARNKRTVWTVTTNAYPEAHFATYPPNLIKPCILAGSRVVDTILDPFAGSGTTGMVALELGRKAILIELNPKYVELIHQRCDITLGLPL